MSVYHPTRTQYRPVPPNRVISFPPPSQLFTQDLTASLSFIGAFTSTHLFLKNFTATLFSGGTAPITDNFNRADGGLGANWTKDPGFSDLAIVSNTCQSTGVPVGGHNVCTYNTVLPADQYAQFKVVNTGTYMGPILRSDGASTFYVCYYQPVATTPTIYKWISDSPSNITGTSFSITPAVGDIIYLEVVGNVLTMKVNGVVAAIATDSSITGAGYAGISIYDTPYAVDDFQAGAIGGDGGPVASLSLSTGKALNAILSFVGNIPRSLSHIFSATLSFVGLLLKKSSRLLSAVLASVGSVAITKLFSRTLTATLSFVGSFSKKATKAVAGTLSFIGTKVIRVFHILTGTLTFVGVQAKKFPKALTATLSFIGNLATQLISGAIQYSQSLFGILSFIGARINRTNRITSGLLSFTGIFKRRVSRIIIAVLSSIGTSGKRAFKSFLATLFQQ